KEAGGKTEPVSMPIYCYMGMACLIKLVYVYFDGGISLNVRPSTLKQQFVASQYSRWNCLGTQERAMPQLTDRSKLPNIVDNVIKNTMDPKHLFQV
ncbi:receptor-like kinase, partial [Trifolium medium]|nr:receptor-like kinase [Trifolium medium]